MTGAEGGLYRINERDEISLVSESWDRFAAGNGGGAVTGEHRRSRAPLASMNFVL